MIWFDPSINQSADILRLACGVFFLPHIWAKIYARSMTLGFFEAAGYRPAGAVMNVALAIEIFVSISLMAGFAVFFIASLAAIFMLVAGLSVLRVSGRKWLWNHGGAEYCFFWAIANAVVALQT